MKKGARKKGEWKGKGRDQPLNHPARKGANPKPGYLGPRRTRGGPRAFEHESKTGDHRTLLARERKKGENRGEKQKTLELKGGKTRIQLPYRATLTAQEETKTNSRRRKRKEVNLVTYKPKGKTKNNGPRGETRGRNLVSGQK